MFNRIYCLIRPDFIAYSLLGGVLTLSSIKPTVARTPVDNLQIAQLPELQSQQPYELDWNSPYSQSSESYLVVVDNTDSFLLQQVRTVEPTAFVNRYQGRSVIRAGVFKRLNNAQARIRELGAYNISSRVYSQSTGREVANSYPTNSYSYDTQTSWREVSRRNNRTKKRSKYYYVAVPDQPNKLLQIENQIRSSAGSNNVGIAVKNSPRGPHVAVGPFAGRDLAEQWSYYIRSLGLKNARVYYGK